MPYAIKVGIDDPDAGSFVFARQKTMYGGKLLAIGDEVFIFHSENEGGHGLLATSVATTVTSEPKVIGIERQTPLINLTLKVVARATRPLGRADLRPFKNWADGRPETELNFKYYRQATDKVVGLSDAAAAFLRGFF